MRKSFKTQSKVHSFSQDYRLLLFKINHSKTGVINDFEWEISSSNFNFKWNFFSSWNWLFSGLEVLRIFQRKRRVSSKQQQLWLSLKFLLNRFEEQFKLQSRFEWSIYYGFFRWRSCITGFEVRKRLAISSN